MWWHTLEIPMLGKPRQEELEIKRQPGLQSDTARPCHQNTRKGAKRELGRERRRKN